jgi:hypothetical protein
MVWNDFVRLFREHHIPNSVMKLKRQEFMSLQQRNLSVTEYLHKFTELSRYAPYEVDTDEKKQDSFLRGLDPELRTVIGAGVYLWLQHYGKQGHHHCKKQAGWNKGQEEKVWSEEDVLTGKDFEAATTHFLHS